MDRFLHLKLPFFPASRASLVLCWLSGLLTGSFFSAEASDSLIPLMRTAAISRVSIDGLLTAILIPFLLSALAVFFQSLWLLPLIAFGKAFLVSFLGVSLMAAYGSAGWLVRWLLMFSECCTLPLLFWYWLRQFSGQKRKALPVTALVMLAAAAVGSLDYCIVSPFLAAVIS